MKNSKILKPIKNKIPYLILIIIFTLIQVYCDLTLPIYTANIVNKGIQYTNFNLIYSTGINMMIMVSSSVLATILISYISSKFSSAYARDLREIVFKKALKFSNNELNNISRSSLITRSTNDINQIQNIFGIMFRTVLFAPILGIGSIIQAYNLGTNLFWIIIVTFLAVIILLVIVMKNVIPFFQKTQEIIDKINRTSREILIGIPVIKAFVRQDYEEKRFEKINKEFLDINLYVYKRIMLLIPAMILILNIMVVLILYFGAYDALDGSILTGNIIAFIQYATQIVSAFVMIGGFIIMFPRVLVSIHRINEVLNTKITIKNGEKLNIKEKSTIEFKNVTYKYPNSEKETLKNINFKLESGKTTAIIGGTGSGKSTIINLIPRLQDVNIGEILLNGINIKQYNLKKLREKISFTPQKALLFSGTIKSNIQKGKTNATDEEIKKALKNAQVDFIENLNEEVSQGGANFSGGQKQRLSIARAIIGDHDFYLFDDCFSALDMNTEAKLKQKLKEIKKESSILLISQRISTIQDADEIIVLDNGEIIDKGTHTELSKRCQIYKEIINSQTRNMEVLQWDETKKYLQK